MGLIHWKPAALALGAVLALSTTTSAQDDTIRLGGSKFMLTSGAQGADTMTLGGQGTVEAARTQDTELARFYRGGFRGGWGGGVRVGWGGPRWGWGGGVRVGWGAPRWGWGGGVRVGWGGPRWGPAFAYRPWVGGVSYVGVSYPVYQPYVVSYPVYSYCGVSATTVDVSAAAIPLNAVAQADAVPVIRIPSNVLPASRPSTSDKTFPYDGGPSKPIPPPIPQPLDTPRPSPDAKPMIPPSDDLRVVFRPKSEYVFKAYGEK